MLPETRLALVIANYQYQDAGLRQLIAPRQDAEALARVLSDPEVGSFQARTLLNEPSYKVNQAIEAFFAERKRDDLLLLYFSGHGVKDEDGQLYFATTDTRRSLLRSTAVSSGFVNDVMHRSRSRRQVLLIDCCYSGAFARGMLAKGEAGIGTQERFAGHGRVVLTASDAMQYSFEGDAIAGKGVRSVFTRTLVSGLETGEADLNSDGLISLDELYDYVHDCVVDETPEQRPGKWAFDVQGEIIIARNPQPAVKPVRPPPASRAEARAVVPAREQPAVSSQWNFGRVIVLFLLLLGFLGPWAQGCTPAATTEQPNPQPDMITGAELLLGFLRGLDFSSVGALVFSVVTFLLPIFLFVLFGVTLLRVVWSHLAQKRASLKIERIVSGLTLLDFGAALLSFKASLQFGLDQLLWGFWFMTIAIVLAPLNLLGEWLAARKRRA